MRQYQIALDSVVESHPRLQRCLTRCVHCGIRFLTHPRNAGRVDLRCPFGCREHHRKQRSSQRSTAYYQTAAGKQKKKSQNCNRYHRTRSSKAEGQPELKQHTTCSNDSPPGRLSVKVALRLDGVILGEWDVRKSRMLPYLRMVVRLVEGIGLSCDELLKVLRQAMRQHSLAYRSRTDYVLSFLHQHPP